MNKQRRGITIRLRLPGNTGFFAWAKWLLASVSHLITSLIDRIRKSFLWQNRKVKSSLLFVTSAFIVANITTLLNPFIIQTSYALGSAEHLLPEIEPTVASNLVHDVSKQEFRFDNKRSFESGTAGSAIGGVSAVAYVDGSKGVAVSDTTNKVDFKLIPTFPLEAGRKDGNRIIYPLKQHSGWAVYTMTNTGTKEDIILNSAAKDELSFTYEMELGSGLKAKLEQSGDIGVYGNTLFSGNISTGTEKDATLLQKARENATKDTLLFTIPAPIIKESVPESGKVKAQFTLDGNKLTVTAKGLKSGNYPLTIDPSIYVVTASQFMYGNNESNINFDVANKLIKKGRTTGATFDSWQSTANLPGGSYAGGSVASGGFIYQVGGANAGNSGATFSTAGQSSYVVPLGTTSLTFKLWGGGGGGATNSTGGGGGYVESTIAVTSGETLTIRVGGGGGGGSGTVNNATSGGGGGYSGVFRGSTALIVAGGGGGGAGRSSTGSGGVGGCTSSGTACNGGGTYGGGGATSSSAGVGTPGYINCGGTSNGSSLQGGPGARLTFNACNTPGGGAAGGTNGGGQGGLAYAFGYYFDGGGGGGGGYYGGGGGGAGNPDNSTTAGGGGGGSSYGSGSSQTFTVGSGQTPGNSSDSVRGTAGNGGNKTQAGTGGLVFIADGRPANNSVSWAKFDTGNGTVVSANPGNGACPSWCSAGQYNLPANRANFSLVAYNGYLYAMGGNDEAGPNSLNHKHKTIYVAKLGSNGEPQLWHPTDTNKANWTYWYHDDTNMTLPSERIFGAATVYNNKMYYIGGLDNSSNAGAASSTVWVADILPNGKLGSWSNGTTLATGGPGATYGASALVYNDYLYLIGGSSAPGTTPHSTNAYYIKINTDGSLASTWTATNSFATGRVTGGGVNATIWNGFMYVAGGCSSMNSNNNCVTEASDTQLASINTDGTLGKWRTVSGVTNTTTGANLLAWRGVIYTVGGCPDQDATTGVCNSTSTNGILYGTIKQDGDISQLSSSAASGSGTCTGTSPTNCDLPGGRIYATSIASNGFLYHIGGCSDLSCTSTSGNVYFTRINSSGNTVRPETCPAGSTADSGWCRATATISGGIAATSAAVFNDTLYLVGGVSTGDTLKNTIQKASINPDGSLGTWSSSSLSGTGAVSIAGAYVTTRANPTAAASNPGNLYIVGGCTSPGGTAVCSSFSNSVYKCSIASSGDVSICSTSSQLQLTTGRALMGGAEYANYLYLVGGASSGNPRLNTAIYAKFDSNNNIVTAGTGWVQATGSLSQASALGVAFAQNGYLYYTGGYTADPGVAASTIQRAKINIETGNIDTGAWQSSTKTLTSGRWAHTTAVAGSYVFITGGCTAGTNVGNCTTNTPTVQRLEIFNNSAGSPAEWSSSANQYSTSRSLAGTAVHNGYLYVAGGCTDGGESCTTTTANIQRAAISSNGSLGTWSNTTADLPAALGGFKLLVAGGTLYAVGGMEANQSNISSTIYYTTPASDGDITSWNTATSPLPAARALYGAAVWNDRLYIVGGMHSSCAASTCQSIYISPKQSSGGDITGTWTTAGNTFSTPRIGASVVAYSNTLYVLGGMNSASGGPYLSDVQFTKIDPTSGNLSLWEYAKSLPTSIYLGDAFAVNGYMYIMGGLRAGATCSTATLIAPVSATTAAKNPTGLGNWFEHDVDLAGAGAGISVQYHKGKAYSLGGYCPAANTSPSVQQSTLLTQPQIAKYSISFDTDTNVYPQSILVNGAGSPSGSEWKLKYRSMSDPGAVTNLGTGIDCSTSVMSNWGQESSSGVLSLGTIGTFIARDTSGIDMSCARYYYLSTVVDAQTSYGFPESTVGEPTITDISLRYTAAPEKRSLHGRTFINGIQAPLDTPKYDF